jgi:glutamate formiminotransferase/glutamate formiminotransferase/formiminotetrahydrofolate cyclodeaminase
VLECVVNVSEGRDPGVIAALADACDDDLLDVHSDEFHHRSVFTLVGTAAPRRLVELAVRSLDLRRHEGAHPRLGVADVVPFVPLAGSTSDDALAARDAFADWAAAVLGVPCFLYGPERSLPEVRRHAWTDLAPDRGPKQPHPTAGAICVGARGVLVAYNLWLASADLRLATRVAALVRGPAVRALGLAVGNDVQVSLNLIDPARVGPEMAYDLVAAHAEIARAELVGLVPEAVLRSAAPQRWAQLDLAPERTIEYRLRARGWSG